MVLVTKNNEVIAYANMVTGRQRPAGWPADKLVAMAVMRTPGRGDWVAVSVATVVESDTEGPDGAAAGGASCHPRYFITAKNQKRDDAGVKMMSKLRQFLKKIQHDVYWEHSVQTPTLNGAGEI